tara:strand:+ start:3889 stop:4551 length:663 start_codon:yes stop_codon:yes gene_type:complete
MKKIFKYTENEIEVDISEAMKSGKEEKKSYGSPEVSKHYFKSKEEAMEDGEKMGLKGVHSHKGEDGKVMYMAGPDHATFMKKHKEIMDKKAKAAMHKKDEKTKAGMHDKKKMDAAHHGKDKDKMKAAYHKDKDTKAAYHKGDKKMKAEMTPNQKGALDKNKDGKISKEDFELLRKEKKESKSMMHKDKDKDKDKAKKIKPKMTYAQLLSDIAAKKYSDGV